MMVGFNVINLFQESEWDGDPAPFSKTSDVF
jgi:hypothetical protein